MKTMEIKALILSLCILVTAVGCGGSGGSSDGGDGGRSAGSDPTNLPSNNDGAGGGAVGVGVPAGGGAVGEAAFVANVYPITRQYCVQCHAGAGPGFPHLAHPDGETAFRAVIDNQKVNLLDPSRSRLVQRLRTDGHFCWSNCAANADEMQAAIQVWADQVVTANPDPNSTSIPTTIIASDGRTFLSATKAESGRYNGNQIAFWKLEEGSGTIALDTSLVGPTMNLTLSGDVNWVSGGGLEFDGGRATSTPEESRKLFNRIASGSGMQHYSVETWVIPANTTQENRSILAYSNSQGVRNLALSQTLYNYVFRNRSLDTTPDDQGKPMFGNPPLVTADADEDLQAMLQHTVITYDQNKGRRIFVNGVFTDDADVVPPAQLFNWDQDATFSVGAEPNGGRAWRGVVKLVAIYDSVLSQNQITQNFNAGASQQYILKFGLDSALANGAYIQFTVSEFDAYSYLFCAPLLVSGGAKGFTVQTIRISVNGVPPVASQSFRTVNAQITEDQTQLSTQCQVVPKDLGSAQDVFHVFFDALGNASSPIADVPASPPPTPGVVPASPGIGIRDFSEINDSMAELTGVPVTNTTVNATFQEILQQLPSNNDVRSFVSAQQVGISRLALDYCDQLIENTGLRTALFGSGFDWTQPANTAFSTAGQRDMLINPLSTRMLGTGLGNQPTATDVRPLLDTLIDQLTAGCTAASCPASQTRNVGKGVCAAVLSSAAVQLH
jgi:hypothetical protein